MFENDIPYPQTVAMFRTVLEGLGNEDVET